MESRHVLAQNLGLVAFWVHRHEEDLEAFGVGTELLRHAGELSHRRRTGVGAMRKAEEQHDDLAFEIGERAPRSGVIGEIE